MATKAKTKDKTDQKAPEQPPAGKVPARHQVESIRAELVLRANAMRTQLPSHVSVEKVQEGVIKAISFNPKLLDCSRHSLVNAALEAAECGLSVSPTLKEADIIPKWTPNGSVAEFRPRYQGFMKLARQSGEIIDIYAHVVHEGDEFDYSLGLDKKLRHVPKVGNKGAIIAAYCVWESKDRVKSFDVMSRDDLDDVRGRSEGYKAFLAKKISSTPWETDHSEMCRKSAVRRASKYMPMATDPFLKAMALDEARDLGKTAKMIDGDVVVVEGDGSFDVTDGGSGKTPAPKGSNNLDRLEDRVTGGKQPIQQQGQQGGPPVIDGDPGPGVIDVTDQQGGQAQPNQKKEPERQPEQAKAAAPAQKPMAIPMADGQPDWDKWFDNACEEIKKLEPQAVVTWEQANEKNIGAFGFHDQQKAEDFRAFIEERSAGQ